MDSNVVATMQQRIISSISRSAVMVLSTTLSRRLNPYFSASELILVLLILHTLLNTVRTVPGFNASWRTLRDLMQFLMVQALASYVSSGSGDSGRDYTTILHLVLVLVTLECIPTKGLDNPNNPNNNPNNPNTQWMVEDVESFTTSVSYIFSDRISAVLTRLNIPLFGATLALCLGSDGGLLGRTLAFVGINALSSLAFEAISGGELSLAWPITLLYFVKELNAKYSGGLDSFFSFGLYRAADAVYASLSARGLPPGTIFTAFLFLGSLSNSLFPSDPVWAGVCVLVFVQGGSDWFLGQLGGISGTDPVLAGLCLVTAVHFISIAVESSARR